MDQVTQSPGARLDYLHDWGVFLAELGGSDTLTAATWVVHPDDADDLTVTAADLTSTTTRVWVEGGTIGNQYRLVNHVTTAGGRESDWTLIVAVDET